MEIIIRDHKQDNVDHDLHNTASGLEERGWLAPEAFITAELEKGAPFSAPESWELLADRAFGQTRILIWKRA